MTRPTIIALDARPLTEAVPQDTASQEPVPQGEPTWDALQALGDLVVHPRTAPDALIKRLQGAQAALTNKVVFTADTLKQLPDLKYIGLTSTGVNVIDLEAAAAQGITVTNVPGYSTASVAQHAFALLLGLVNQVAPHNQSVHQGDWAKHPDFSYTLSPLTELAGKKLLVVGMGSIGQHIAQIGHAMGMQILAANQSSKDRVNAMQDIARLNVTWGDIDTLLPQADVVSLSCPLTEQTQHLINAERLQTMQTSALLINTGRGPLIDEAALAEALQQNQIAGAGLDVLSQEPPQADNPLFGLDNCLITPHVAWASQAARGRLMQEVADNYAAFLQNQQRNVVTPAPARGK